jgi:hypothetical protein
VNSACPSRRLVCEVVPHDPNAALCLKSKKFSGGALPAIRHIRQPLNDVFALRHAHNWNTRDLSDPPLQISVVGRDQVDAVLHDPIDDAVVGVGALVVAREALPAFVARNSQRNTVLWTKLLQLSHDTGGDDGCGFGVEQVHEGLVELELGVHSVREEVGIDEDRVWGAERRVGLEEESRRDLGALGLLAVAGRAQWLLRHVHLALG